MRGEEVRLLVSTGLSLASMFAGKRKRKVNAILANLAGTLDIYDGLAAFEKRLGAAVAAQRGINLTVEEATALYGLITQLKNITKAPTP